MTTDISIDDLFREARAAARVQKVAKEAAALKKQSEKPDAQETQALFANPDNWQRTRGIALIHAETETLLGQFSEYTHKSVPNCRKLLRESAPISVEAAERVSGNWWLGSNERVVEPRQEWHTKRPAIIHLHLDTLRVHSPACEVIACLSYGGLARVELALDTMFAQEEGKQEQLLHLPAGTNVLPMMSLDSKIALRIELGQ